LGRTRRPVLRDQRASGSLAASVSLPEWLRSALAIVADVVTIGVLALGADELTRRIAPAYYDAPDATDRFGVQIIMILYTAAISTLGGWTTARISGRTNLRDVWILTGIQLIVTIVAIVASYDGRFAWFYACTLLTAPESVWIGGWIHNRRQS